MYRGGIVSSILTPNVPFFPPFDSSREISNKYRNLFGKRRLELRVEWPETQSIEKALKTDIREQTVAMPNKPALVGKTIARTPSTSIL